MKIILAITLMEILFHFLSCNFKPDLVILFDNAIG
jgi:hypothetical protein